MSDQSLAQLDAELDANTVESIPIPAPTAPGPMSMGAVLRVVTLRRLWYAQIVSVLGDFLALFAVITVMTFKLHATPQQVTGVQIAYLLPIALLGIVSGVFVDRWPVKTTLVSSDFTRAVLVLLLLLVHDVYGYYAVLAAISIVSSFFSPAQGVAIRSAVPFHGLRSATALMQQAMFIMRIVGPSAAAFLVAGFGAKSCYLIDTASFLVSGSLIASLTLIVPKPKKTSAMIGLGLLLGVNALNAFAKRVKNTTQVYFGLGGIAAGTALLAFVPHVASAIFGCFAIGFSAAGIIVPSQTLIQEETPADLMGRVGSTVMSAIFTAQIAGLILSGILAEHTSVRRVFALCTAMLAALIAAGKLWMEPKDHPAIA